MRFTKAAALILSLSIAGMSLAACSNEPEPVSSDINIISTQAQGKNTGALPHGVVDPNAESENFVFKYKGCNLVVNTVVDESKFPDDDYVDFETTSCASPELTRRYEFKNGTFWMELYPGSESIYTIVICNDIVSTAEGIYIGCTAEQVREAYGEPAQSTDALLLYEKGSSELRFSLNTNGEVDQIFYVGKY